MLPDLNRLRVFYLIYSLKSIVAAAGELHITQSAVSQNLRKLEGEIKTKLFTRLHKRLVPTMAGERLFALIAPFMEGLASGIGDIRQAQQTPSGPIRVGAPPEFGRLYFPGIFASFRTVYPDVVFFLKLGDPATLLSMVSDGDLDLAFVDMFPVGGQVSDMFTPFGIEPVIEEEVILACSKEYYFSAVKKNHAFEHLSGLAFIEYQHHAVVVKNWFRHHFGRAPSRLNIVMTVDSIQAVIAGIRHHLGLGVIASHMAWKEISTGEMVPIRTGKTAVINKISLVQLQDKVPTLSERTFLAHFRKEMQVSGMLKHFRRIGR
ncbi:MAG: LysR family transcriptional regulator [Desulfobacterales bacterium]|nr:LysR family transcriptional regulator [Desulfobacterales bacterium]